MINVINLRWKIYNDFLITNLGKYNLVLSSDVRDVFFQSDPFEYYNGNKSFLGVAIEDGILAYGINKKWFIDAYGEKLHKTIKRQRIIINEQLYSDMKCNYKVIERSKNK